MTLEPSTIVDSKYRIVDLLGEGGMGAVYRAQHLLTERQVALKVLHPGRGQEVQARRFKTEVTVAGKVVHPGIVQVFDAGREEATGRLWFAMEMLVGESLRDVMDREAGEPEGCVRWLVEALDVMVAAHEQGVLHRDLKPENLFIEKRDGEPDRLRVVDFGIARDLARPSRTTTGSAVGTAHYMAPEQATAKRGIGPAVDVWAFGVMLYECLSGELPFDGPSVHAVVVDAVTEPHTPLAELRPDLPETWSQLVDACLTKNPAHRIGADTLRDSLRVLLDEGGDLAPIFELAKRPSRGVVASPDEPRPVELAETIEAHSVSLPAKASEPTPTKRSAWPLAALLLSAPVLLVGGWFGLRAASPAAAPSVVEPAAAPAPAEPPAPIAAEPPRAERETPAAPAPPAEVVAAPVVAVPVVAVPVRGRSSRPHTSALDPAAAAPSVARPSSAPPSSAPPSSAPPSSAPPNLAPQRGVVTTAPVAPSPAPPPERPAPATPSGGRTGSGLMGMDDFNAQVRERDP